MFTAVIELLVVIHSDVAFSNTNAAGFSHVKLNMLNDAAGNR